MVYFGWALKGLLFPYFGVCISTIVMFGPFGVKQDKYLRRVAALGKQARSKLEARKEERTKTER